MIKQKGMTLIGMLLTLAVVVVFGLILMRVVPIFIQNYEVKHSIRALANLDADNFSMDTRANVHILKNKLMNQLYISGVDIIKRDNVEITPKSANTYEIKLKYEAKRKFIRNVYIVVEFDEQQEIDISV